MRPSGALPEPTIPRPSHATPRAADIHMSIAMLLCVSHPCARAMGRAAAAAAAERCSSSSRLALSLKAPGQSGSARAEGGMLRRGRPGRLPRVALRAERAADRSVAAAAAAAASAALAALI
eukprot:363692-Chlamydomonas_euryale.AAC.7